MGVYVVTGCASGMGRAVAERLGRMGHEVVGVDVRAADVRADLATVEGRAFAAATVLELTGGRLDGAVTAAGLAGSHDVDNSRQIAAVNYLGTVELLDAWRPALEAASAAKVVAFSSNAATTAPVPPALVAAVMSGDGDRVLAASRSTGAHAPGLVYAATKVAVARWVRRAAVRPEWIGAGIRLNCIAPGVVLTPMVQAQMGDDDIEKRIHASPLPVGELGRPEDIAEWVTMMLSPAARFLCGSVIMVDGGTDAWFRGEDWPAPNDPESYRARRADFGRQ